MSGVCGLVARDPALDPRTTLARMLDALARFPNAGRERVTLGRAGLARVVNRADVARDPSAQPWQEGGWTVLTRARLDDPDAARRRFAPGCDAETMPDGRLLARVLARDDPEAFASLFGDWILAGWHAASGTLRIVREPYGYGTLYLGATDGLFAFSSAIAPLLELPGVDRRIDEMRLARSLSRFEGGEGFGTVFRGIEYLPPGQCLSWRDGRAERVRYWKMEESFTRFRGGYAEAAEALREALARAVASRTRGLGRVATMLSSGLDSSSVTAFAARGRAADAPPLDAYASVPLYPARTVGPPRAIADEGPLARAFAASLPNLRFVPIDAADLTPIEGVELTVDTASQPYYATSNDHWLHSLHARAAADGNEAVLNGATGNLTMSWGYLYAQSALDLLLAGRPRPLLGRLYRWTRARLRDVGRRAGPDQGLHAYSCIAPEFAERLRLNERMRAEGRDPRLVRRGYRSGLAERIDWLDPEHGAGVIQSVLAARHGLDVLDPSADTALILLTLSFPERLFMGPRAEHRWLFREAMRNVLPDTVRLNRRRGYQAADLNARLRADGERMERLLARFDAHDAVTAMLDVGYLREVWDRVQGADTLDRQQAAWTILLNGIAAGTFLLRHG